MRIRRKGNTIIEVLVAAAIGAMVLIGLYMLLGQGASSSGATEEQAQLNQKLIFFVEQLQHDLRRAVRFVRDGDRFLLTIRVEGDAAVGGSQYQIIQYEISDDGKAVVRAEGATLAGAEGTTTLDAPDPTAASPAPRPSAWRSRRSPRATGGSPSPTAWTSGRRRSTSSTAAASRPSRTSGVRR
jgi:hypothetical protein